MNRNDVRLGEKGPWLEAEALVDLSGYGYVREVEVTDPSPRRRLQ